MILKMTMDYKRIIGYSSVLYGESESGKTTLVKDIISEIGNYIPFIIVIAPTEKQNRNF